MAGKTKKLAGAVSVEISRGHMIGQDVKKRRDDETAPMDFTTGMANVLLDHKDVQIGIRKEQELVVELLKDPIEVAAKLLKKAGEAPKREEMKWDPERAFQCEVSGDKLLR